MAENPYAPPQSEVGDAPLAIPTREVPPARSRLLASLLILTGTGATLTLLGFGYMTVRALIRAEALLGGYLIIFGLSAGRLWAVRAMWRWRRAGVYVYFALTFVLLGIEWAAAAPLWLKLVGTAPSVLLVWAVWRDWARFERSA